MIFLSYPSEEEAVANELSNALHARGLAVWRDREALEPGDRWILELQRRLSEASGFLILIGTQGITGWMQAELDVALDRTATEPSFPLVPILLANVPVDSLPPFLRRHVAVDLPHLSSIHDSSELDRLVKRLTSGRVGEGGDGLTVPWSTSDRFDPRMREILCDLCSRQVEAEIAAFVGQGPRDETYIERDGDAKLLLLVQPWAPSIPEPDDRAGSRLMTKLLKEQTAQLFSPELKGRLDAVAALEQTASQMFSLEVAQSVTAVLRLLRVAVSNDSPNTVSSLARDLVDAFARELVARPLLDSADNLKRQFFEAGARRSLQGLEAACQSWFAVERHRETLGLPAFDQAHLLSWELSRVLAATESLRTWAERVLKTASNRHCAFLANAGQGKTWSLARVAQRLAPKFPVFFLSARDALWRQASGLSDALTAILNRLNPTEPITREELVRLFRASLVGDETVSVIIDGIDATSDTEGACAQLLTLRAEAGPLPVRTIVSCRTTYWSWFRATYEGRPGSHVVTDLIGDFTNAELAGKAQPRELWHGPRGRPASPILLHPLVFGFVRALAQRGLSSEFLSPSKNLCDVLDLYVDHLSREVAVRCEVPTSWVEWLIGAASELAFGWGKKLGLERSASSSFGRAGLRKRAERETGEYHPQVLEALSGAGLFVSSPTEVCFGSDLIAEFTMARRLKERCEIRTPTDISHFVARNAADRKRVPTNLGVLAFVAARFAREGIELWDEIDFEFDGYEDWIAQINYVVGPAETTESLVRALFRNNLRRMQCFLEALPGSNATLLGSFSDLPGALFSDAADEREQVGRALPIAVPSRSLTYRVHGKRWAREDLPDEVKPDFDFWFRDLPVQLIPRLASREMPVEARRLLTRACIRVCADRRVPSELTEAVYPPLARSFAEAGGHLAHEERLQVLICDDESRIWKLLLRLLLELPAGEGMQDFVQMETVEDGNAALQRLNERRWSQLVIDQMHPGPSGIEVVRRFRADGPADWRTCTLVTFLTACAPEDDAFTSSDADAFFSKPLGADELSNMIFGYAPRDHHHLDTLEKRFLALIAQAEDGESK